VIDLHCHLLPGIDDGPADLEESLALCRMLVADGVTHAVVTPHIHPGRWDNEPDDVSERLDRLCAAVDAEGLALDLGFAAEVRVTDELMRQLESNALPFYGKVDGYHILLLEFPHGHIVPGAENLLRWLLDRGIRPLIAHPERNKQVMRDFALLHRFTEAGCWLQVTAGSLTGRFGEPAMLCARQLLDEDMVAVLASDTHNTGARAPRLTEAYEFVIANYDRDFANRLLFERPALIAADQFRGSRDFTTITASA
jgi:protein-tyrosine phosphatase